jgi:hypothetical protein
MPRRAIGFKPMCVYQLRHPGSGIGFYVRSSYEHMFVYGPDAPSAVILFHRMGFSRKASSAEDR